MFGECEGKQTTGVTVRSSTPDLPPSSGERVGLREDTEEIKSHFSHAPQESCTPDTRHPTGAIPGDPWPLLGGLQRTGELRSAEQER